MRVVLLFYLMPLWAVLLAWLMLGERLTALALLRVALALAGAVVVLWPTGGGLPLPSTLAEWLSVVGGFSFALNNVMLRREAASSGAARAMAMFGGGALVAGLLGLVLSAQGTVPWPPQPALGWVAATVVMGLFFLASNLALQFGAARLVANATAVVLISEVLCASGSAVLLGGSVVTTPLWVGGSLIVTAALLAALD